MSYAHTQVKLFNQLQEQDYGLADLAKVRDAYGLAMQLFSGLYRPSGNTFISHLVGTASILARLHSSAALVSAGLLHAAYDHGDFGSGLWGTARSHRARLEGTVGPEVEDYVARYHALTWNSASIVEIRDRLDGLGPRDRDVVLLRLTNELEDCLDSAVAYCSNVAARRSYLERFGPLMQEMAQRLEAPELASELHRVVAENLAASVPDVLRTGPRRDRAYMLAPPSYRMRLLPALGRMYARARRAVKKRCGTP